MCNKYIIKKYDTVIYNIDDHTMDILGSILIGDYDLDIWECIRSGQDTWTFNLTGFGSKDIHSRNS